MLHTGSLHQQCPTLSQSVANRMLRTICAQALAFTRRTSYNFIHEGHKLRCVVELLMSANEKLTDVHFPACNLLLIHIYIQALCEH